MSPLVTVFVIMLLTVVYNESQFVADYQDDQKDTRNTMPFDLLCDTKRKKCAKSYLWSELFKNTDYDAQDFGREYIEDEDVKIENIKIGQKRNDPRQFQSLGADCATVKNHVDLGDGYFPRIIGNVTCDQTSNKEGQGCWPRWSCRPIKSSTKVLRQTLNDIPVGLPQELKQCWQLEEIPIHDGCECAQSFHVRN